MFFGLKLTTLAWLFVASASILTGTYGAGFYMGANRNETKHEKSIVKDFTKRVEKALIIADVFVGIATEAEREVQESRTGTQQTVSRGRKHVENHPIAGSAVLDDYLIQLRSCQIDRTYRAAGRELPRERAGATCPPALPVEQPGGINRHK